MPDTTPVPLTDAAIAEVQTLVDVAAYAPCAKVMLNRVDLAALVAEIRTSRRRLAAVDALIPGWTETLNMEPAIERMAEKLRESQRHKQAGIDYGYKCAARELTAALETP